MILPSPFPEFSPYLQKGCTIAKCWEEINQSWNLGFKRSLFDSEIPEWALFTEKTDLFQCGIGKDRIRWKSDGSGSFSARLAFASLVRPSKNLDSSVVNTIWVFKVPKKVKIFLWSFFTEVLIRLRNYKGVSLTGLSPPLVVFVAAGKIPWIIFFYTDHT